MIFGVIFKTREEFHDLFATFAVRKGVARLPRQQRKECIEKKAGKLADAAKQDGWSYKLNALPGTDLPALLVQPGLLLHKPVGGSIALFKHAREQMHALSLSHTHAPESNTFSTRIKVSTRMSSRFPDHEQIVSCPLSSTPTTQTHTQLRRFSTSFKHACPDHDNPDRQEELRNLAWTMRAARSFLKVSENE